MNRRGGQVRVHVERLVVEGVALAPRDRARLEAAVIAELTRLFRAGDIPSTASFVARVDAPPVTMHRPMNPAALGAGIAQSVHIGIGSAGGQAGNGVNR